MPQGLSHTVKKNINSRQVQSLIVIIKSYVPHIKTGNEKLMFKNWEEFLTWKEEEEASSNSYFAQSSGSSYSVQPKGESIETLDSTQDSGGK